MSANRRPAVSSAALRGGLFSRFYTSQPTDHEPSAKSHRTRSDPLADKERRSDSHESKSKDKKSHRTHKSRERSPSPKRTTSQRHQNQGNQPHRHRRRRHSGRPMDDILDYDDATNYKPMVTPLLKREISPRSDQLIEIDPRDAKHYNGDVIEFSIMEADFSEPALNTWRAVAKPNSIKSGTLTKAAVRQHVAEHLGGGRVGVSERAFGLWYRYWPDTDQPPLKSSKHGAPKKKDACAEYVRIIMDPYIRLLVDDRERHTLDYSTTYVNKAAIPISRIKRRIKQQLNLQKGDQITVWLGGELLQDNSITLEETGLLSDQELSGWDPIQLRVEVIRSAKTCILCTDDLDWDLFPDHISQRCSHEVNTCLHCLDTWMDSRMKSVIPEEFDKIKCPECSQALSYDDVKRITKPETFEIYDRGVTQAALSHLPNFHHCIRPNCRSGQIHASSDPIFVCYTCGARKCIRHEREWHEGETCREYDDRTSGAKARREDAASSALIDRTTKKCPKCRTSIEKNDGCDHMSCTRCKHEFCWLCMANYNDVRRIGNSAHKRNCRYANI